MASTRYDYIVVGGGSAGCVVASRLVAASGARVLLVEAGPRRSSPILGMPAGYMKYLARDTYLTMHRVAPQPQLDGRAPIVPQAKVLGGGSAVNAMVYIRGAGAGLRRLGRGARRRRLELRRPAAALHQAGGQRPSRPAACTASTAR